MTEQIHAPLPITLASLTAPVAATTYCRRCQCWYDPADPQGNWQHVSCS